MITKQFDPYVKLVGKRVTILLTSGDEISGKLFQTTGEAIVLQRKKSRMVVQKNHILYSREIVELEKDDSFRNHLRRSK